MIMSEGLIVVIALQVFLLLLLFIFALYHYCIKPCSKSGKMGYERFEGENIPKYEGVLEHFEEMDYLQLQQRVAELRLACRMLDKERVTNDRTYEECLDWMFFVSLTLDELMVENKLESDYITRMRAQYHLFNLRIIADQVARQPAANVERQEDLQEVEQSPSPQVEGTSVASCCGQEKQAA